MKKIFLTLAVAFLGICTAFAQDSSKADRILGKYESIQAGDAYKVAVTKNADGTYKAQIYWILDEYDPKTGKLNLDDKNPDKSLRSVPSSQVVLVKDFKYNAEKDQWGDTKIYDPQRGIKVNATASFLPDGRLCIKGTVLGIGEKAYWTPINE